MEPGDFLVIYSSCAVFRNPCSSLLPSNMSRVLDGWSFWAGKGRTAWDVSWTFHMCLTLFHFQAWCHGLALLISDNLRSFLPSSFQTAVIYQMLVTSLYLRIGISERKGQDKKIHCTSMLKLSLPMNNFNTQFTHFYRKPSK